MKESTDFASIKINLASPERIREISYGVVKKPETINYRTLKPERDGLFCERIFGTTKEWECACGKFKGIRYRGIVCDRCGVEVSHFKVRRERMGHIELAAPVAHIWFYGNVPSRIGLALNISINDVKSVVYYERIIVININDNVLKEVDDVIPTLLKNRLKEKDVYPEEIFLEIIDDVVAEVVANKHRGEVHKEELRLEEEGITEIDIVEIVKRLFSEEFFEMRENIKDYIVDVEFMDRAVGEIKAGIVIGMGAYALKKLLQNIDIDKEIQNLRIKMHDKAQKTDKKILKQLELYEDFRNSGNKPEWMVLEVLPVIPPELRPMVQLDGGRFATSDLNDLYRRVINRNNRLRRLMTLRAPDIILRNEKRMLQEAVDALFDNSRKKRVVKGAGGRPLKSLSDMLRGKQGRFRQNLLGKRVDYSGRSVIVVGPKLKLHEVGIPKKMALELFKPFIMKKLEDYGKASNIKSAKKLIDKSDDIVWGVLEDVIKNHPVFINRAPTLHRLSIQAFKPVLIEGKAIQLHPMVCKAFNADFDGDQMAVHVPLSVEAQLENWMLMLSSRNLISPANGCPVVVPTQDMVLGIGFLTKVKKQAKGSGRIFSSKEEVCMAYESDVIELNSYIKVKIDDNLFETTYGRIIFNDLLPEDYPFQNIMFTGNRLSKLIDAIYRKYGTKITAEVLDKIKEIGFHYATVYGISIGLDDIIEPDNKDKIVAKAKEQVEEVEEHYRKGYITNSERYNRVIDIWGTANDNVSADMLARLEKDRDGFNPVHMMVETGARGSKQQIRQLGGMRGLMAKPSGEIIELPIISNFKEGLTVLEYFISTHGARKGLADTALKTANAGYLTRRLVDVAQDVVVVEDDCGTINGIELRPDSTEEDDMNLFRNRILGRVALENIYVPNSKKIILRANNEITEEIADTIIDEGVDRVKVRSVLTCDSKHGVCRMCYGRDLATGRLVNKGEAVGTIAAQSIGEPGTQLTLRTFHIGGTAYTEFKEGKLQYGYTVYIEKTPKKIIVNSKGEHIVSRRSEIVLRYIYQEWDKKGIKLSIGLNKKVAVDTEIGVSDKNEKIIAKNNGILKEIDNKYVIASDRKVEKLRIGTQIFVEEKEFAPTGKIIATFDSFFEPIITEHAGTIKFKDIILGQTLKEERDEEAGVTNRVIIKSKERELDLQPRITVVRDDGKSENYVMPYRANLVVREGDKVEIGDVIAKIPEKISKTKDITGGLPRVEELFEAREPKDCAIVSEIDGVIEFGGVIKGKRIVKVKNEVDEERKYLIPIGKHLTVHEGDMVKAGDSLDDGPIDPMDILRIKGEQELQEYLLNEVQSVYRLQGVKINDKHIEVIIRQMMRRVKITEAGDTRFIVGDFVDKIEFREENERVLKEGGKPAMGSPTLLGITKASLSTDSFISAASFQQTTRVLTNAAIKGITDRLLGLKENVIIGRLIPAGTGLATYRDIEVDVKTPRVKKAEDALFKPVEDVEE